MQTWVRRAEEGSTVPQGTRAAQNAKQVANYYNAVVVVVVVVVVVKTNNNNNNNNYRHKVVLCYRDAQHVLCDRRYSNKLLHHHLF